MENLKTLCGKRITTMICRILVLIIKAYQILVSPFFPPTCRFFPSCSSYAMDAFRKHRLFKGAFLTAKRICKCHPFHEGGIDPVP